MTSHLTKKTILWSPHRAYIICPILAHTSLFPSSAFPESNPYKGPLEGSFPRRFDKGECFFTQNMMEVDGRTYHSNGMRHLENPKPSDIQRKTTENNSNSSTFVNHAAIAWNENRKKWTGNASQRSGRTSNDPIISWSTTYEDLLSTQEPFSKPIPLYEMVDFLVDIWHGEGLGD